MNNDNNLMPQYRFPEFKNNGSWIIEKIENLFKTYSGGTPTSTEGRYYNGTIPFIRSAEIDRKNTELSLTEDGFNSSSAKMVEQGDLLMALYGANSGDVAISKINGAINQAVLCLKSSNYNLYTKYYLEYSKKRIVNKFIQGGQGNLSGDIIKSILLPIPPIKSSEQQKIAACLSSLDDVIAGHEEKLTALEEHKKGLIQNLFPQEGETQPKYRFPEFENDGDWVEKKLGDVTNYSNGRAHEQEIDLNGKFVVVNSKFISSDGIVVKYSNTANCLASKNDVLMVLSDVPNGKAIAKCYLVEIDDKYTVNQRVCKLTPKSDIDARILYYITNRNKYFLGFDDGVKQTNLRNEDVLNFVFLLPKKLIEQQKIASVLSSVDALIIAQREKIEALKEHKKGLMQGLFPKIES